MPVFDLLGGPVRDELVFYATGARPDHAKRLGFIGGKLPVHHGPAEGAAGLRENLEELATMRERVGDDFWLMWDCWMSLDLNYATKLALGSHELGLKWIEEALPPDDYWGYRDLRAAVPRGMLVTTGEHEATRWGFRLLLEMGCADIIQPDVGWCGGITELLKISALADAHGAMVVPHGSSVYSYHFVVTRHNSPFAEFLMMAPEADQVVPMFTPLLLGEPVPENGRLGTRDAWLRRRAQPRLRARAPDRTLRPHASRAAAAARSAARLTSSAWIPGTAAMAPLDSRTSGAPA